MKPEEKGQKVNKKQHNFKNAVQKKKKKTNAEDKKHWETFLQHKWQTWN